MFFSDAKNPFVIEERRGDLSFRFSNSFNKTSRDFEDNYIRLKSSEYIIFTDDSNNSRDISWPNLSHWQSYHFLDNQNKPFYLLQMRNERTSDCYQIVIHVEISRLGLFWSGNVLQWIMKSDESSLSDQYELIKQLMYFCKRHTKLMSMRIQPYMPGIKKLDSSQELLSQLGFIEVAPLSNIKTRMIDLRPSIEEILSSFSANGRARLKIKSKDTDKIEIKEISDVTKIPFLQNALNDSFKRSIKKECPYNFLPLFLRAKQFANEVIMLGFYFKEEALEPKAFITGIRHGNITEYSVGGSLSDSRLRQFPFNHLLMWQLVIHSKKNGSELLDMGGITEGGEDDALVGITNFKRLFPGFEISTGREMQVILRPRYNQFHSMLKLLKNFKLPFLGKHVAL
jgi:hypothetical protein